MRRLRRSNRAWAECTVMLVLAKPSEGTVPETASETLDPAETQAGPLDEGTPIRRIRHGAASAGGERLLARPAWSSSFGMPVSGVRSWTVAKFRAKQRSPAEEAPRAPHADHVPPPPRPYHPEAHPLNARRRRPPPDRRALATPHCSPCRRSATTPGIPRPRTET